MVTSYLHTKQKLDEIWLKAAGECQGDDPQWEHLWQEKGLG